MVQSAPNGASHNAPVTGQTRVVLPTVSIVIKALNEEAKIARCIESAAAALSEIPNPSEIILADSVSTDRTVEIALQYPVKIVQFQHVNERGCGAAVQLGYQHSRGEFVMLLDGDMALLPGFLPQALARMAANPRLAGVAGLMVETSIANAFDRKRVAKGASNRPLPNAHWLNGGGLYRRDAIEDAGGYAADRNLKAWEEAELGMRLKAGGWLLVRIDMPSTLHTGHDADTPALLRSMWRSGRPLASGVLIRKVVGKPWMMKTFRLLLQPILVVLLWVCALAAIVSSVVARHWGWVAGYGVLVAAFVLLLVVYKRSLRQALVSLAVWHYLAAGLLLGLMQPTVSASAVIASRELSLPMHK